MNEKFEIKREDFKKIIELLSSKKKRTAKRVISKKYNIPGEVIDEIIHDYNNVNYRKERRLVKG